MAMLNNQKVTSTYFTNRKIKKVISPQLTLDESSGWMIVLDNYSNSLNPIALWRGILANLWEP